jgi:hypothetical protein
MPVPIVVSAGQEEPVVSGDVASPDTPAAVPGSEVPAERAKARPRTS